jgi:NAD(P)-dependent dehydrogenase (short-subunit alcohol dehydrogenase family)
MRLETGQPRVAPSVNLPEADRRDTLDLNLTAYFVLSQELARGMLERTSGSGRRRPDDIAGAAVCLTSDDVSLITGEVPTVDGGWSACAYI